MSIRNTKDFYASAALLAFCPLMYWETYNIDMSIVYALGSTFFPRIIIVFMFIMSALLFVKSVDFKAAQAAKSVEARKPLPREVLYQFGAVALLALYLFALPRVGYVLATIVFVFITILMLGPKTKKDIAIYLGVALFVAFFLEYIFAKVLKLFLP